MDQPMNTTPDWKRPHSTRARARVLVGVFALVCCGTSVGWAQQPDSRPSTLRSELTALLRAGRVQDAVRRAQSALAARPDDAAIREEYAQLHLALAERWLTERDYDAAQAALSAVLGVQPENERAVRLRGALDAARSRAAEGLEQLDQLLRLELYESALEQAREIRRLRPELSDALAAREQAAWLGAADDHFLAHNFSEAFSLYENLLALAPDAAAAVHSRWALSLALALAEEESQRTRDPDAAGRLLARAIDVLRKTDEPVVGPLIGALLAEQAGEYLRAGQTYAEALGVAWELPAADRRRAALAELRRLAIARLRERYELTQVGRRAGVWTIALPGAWKHRRTPHFDIHAHNDLLAERLAEAAEFHYAGICRWLGLEPRPAWEPRCELRLYVTLEEFQAATGAASGTRAFSRTRLEGLTTTARQLAAFQADPWLLSSTLPHELTHLLLADVRLEGKLPLAISEGLALQAEPPARRLQFRLALQPTPPDPFELLAADATLPDQTMFYAHADALVSLLLHQIGTLPETGDASSTPPPRRLAERFCEGVPADWWTQMGWLRAEDLRASWETWYADRCRPQRLPLMILTEPAPEHRKQIPADSQPARSALPGPRGP